jgi:hypothetical protein
MSGEIYAVRPAMALGVYDIFLKIMSQHRENKFDNYPLIQGLPGHPNEPYSTLQVTISQHLAFTLNPIGQPI